jgi:hypothetical protein
MIPSEQEELFHIDATTFQEPLGKLAEVLAQKLNREAPKIIPDPQFVANDLYVLTRKAMRTYDLLFYLNADERREGDCYWRNVYSVAAFPLIRTMIDCLFNITTILQEPAKNGLWFRKSGFKKALDALKEDESRYSGQPKWDSWIARMRNMLDVGIRLSGLTLSEVETHKPSWPTLGKYVLDKKIGGTTTAHQDFLRTSSYGRWREYSAMSHGAYEGLLPVACFYVQDSMLHEQRASIDETFPRVLSMHIGRAAGIILSIVTELQAYFSFDDDGARINERIHKMWKVLMPVPEIKELYDEHYDALMKSRNII